VVLLLVAEGLLACRAGMGAGLNVPFVHQIQGRMRNRGVGGLLRGKAEAQSVLSYFSSDSNIFSTFSTLGRTTIWQ
jgi:hypothetical protein